MGIQINGNTNNINAGIGSLSIEDINELDIVGVATAANFKTGVSNLHNLGLTLSGGQLDVGSNIKIGNAGVITATTFSGSGANLTNLNASNIASGTVPTARLGSGTANSSTFLRGDSTFQTVNTDLVSDTSPQLGGTLDTNNQDITFNGAQNVSWDSSAADFIFNDYAKINLGTDKDFKMYQAGNNTILQSANTSGGVYLQGSLVQVGSETGEPGVKYVKDNQVELYFDNNKKIETTNTGAIVTGILTATTFKGILVPTTYAGGRRNMFINGEFAINQRGDRDPHANQNNGANNLQYGGPDHVQVVKNIGSYTAKQANEHSSPRTQAGAVTSYELDVTATGSTSNTGYSFLNFMWNGHEANRLMYGTSSARPITISFWCQCNLTGTFGINLRNYGSDRMISQALTINSANTWEYKTVTFVGDTSAALSVTINAALAMEIWLAAGTDYNSGTPQSTWASRNDTRRSAGTNINIASNTSNYFRISLLQVEMGEYATPFEFRTYGEYLHDCEYYFQKPFSSRGSNQAFAIHIWGHKIADTYALRVQAMMRPTEMRTNPTDYFHDNNPSGLTAQRFQTQGSDYEYTYGVSMSIGSNRKEFAGGTKYPYEVNGITSAQSGILFAYDFESYAEY